MLRPGGLPLADHVAATLWPARAAQALIELVSVPGCGEDFRRRPIMHVQALDSTHRHHSTARRPRCTEIGARGRHHPASRHAGTAA